jgi:hypothetical protein
MPVSLTSLIEVSYKGQQGDQGSVGSQGLQGTSGVQGRQGVAAAQGTTGAQGTAGTTGAQGAQGIQGISGPLTVAQNSQVTSYTLAIGDVGKHISITSGGVTVPSSVFSTGDIISIYNNSSSEQTITQGASTTLRLAGSATTGNRTLAQYGICTILCVSSNIFVISGAGLS